MGAEPFSASLSCEAIQTDGFRAKAGLNFNLNILCTRALNVLFSGRDSLRKARAVFLRWHSTHIGRC